MTVQFPAMRREVMAALASLADERYQQAVWLGLGGWPGYVANLQLAVNVLYDDCQVLPEPSIRIGSVLVDDHEVARLRELGNRLDELLARHEADDDSVFLADPAWPSVREAAAGALTALVLAGAY